MRRIRSTRNVRRSSRVWSWAARYQRPEWTTRPCGLSSRSDSLARKTCGRRSQPAAAADRVGEEQHRSGIGGGGARRPREARVSPRAPRPGGGASSGSTRLIFASAPSTASGEPSAPEPRGREEAEHDDDRLLVARASAAAAGTPAGSDSRRRRRAGPRPGSRAPAARRCSAARCAHRSRAGRRSRARSASGRAWRSSSSSSRRAVGRGHAQSQAGIEGGIRPICRLALARDDGGGPMTTE